MTWTPEKDATLTRFWLTGLSASKIGVLVGKTKNAVIGRRKRLELPQRESPICPKKRELGLERNARQDPRNPRMAKVPKFEPSNLRERGAEKHRPRLMSGGAKFKTCQYPMDNGLSLYNHPHDHQDSGKCGEPVWRESSYCQVHHQICYVTPERKAPPNDPRVYAEKLTDRQWRAA